MADGTHFPRQAAIELLTSACPHTAMLMGLDGPTREDHASLIAHPKATQTWFAIWDGEGNCVDLNEATAVLFAEAIMKRVQASKARAAA